MLTFATNASNINFIISASTDYQYQHGIAMSVSWGCLAVIGVLAARYFKYLPYWIYIHVLCLLTASILTMVYASNTYKQDQNNISSMDSSTFEHSRLGMTISSIVISQATFGFLSSYFRIFTKNLQALSLINKIHKVVGYSLLITGLVNCYSGWDLYTDIGDVLIIVAIAVSIVLFVSFELYQICFVNHGKSNKKLPEMNQI